MFNDTPDYLYLIFHALDEKIYNASTKYSCHINPH